MNQQQHTQGPDFDLGRALGWSLVVCRALAASVEVFLHKAGTFGERYLGVQVALALVLMLVFPGFFPEADAAPLLWFDAAFFVRCLLVRTATAKRRWRNESQPHSYYTGTPWLQRARSRLSETQFKGAAEPLLVAFLGGVLAEWNRPLGTFLVLAALGQFVSVLVSVRHDRTRALDMNDAMVNQRRIADQWRGMRRD